MLSQNQAVRGVRCIPTEMQPLLPYHRQDCMRGAGQGLWKPRFASQDSVGFNLGVKSWTIGTITLVF